VRFADITAQCFNDLYSFARNLPSRKGRAHVSGSVSNDGDSIHNSLAHQGFVIARGAKALPCQGRSLHCTRYIDLIKFHADMVETGYRHRDYAASLAEFGQPVQLPHSGGWVLRRPIPGHADCDALGCYPLFTCANWSALGEDLGTSRPELVSLVVVADPFGLSEPEPLAGSFSHGLIPYKQHSVIDLSRPLGWGITQHHRRNIRQALGRVSVERVENSAECLDEWCGLYAELVVRHRITGIAGFSRKSFAMQWCVPGLVAFRAVADGATVGMILWYLQGDVGYYHLAAYTARGYELKASFALFWYSLEAFHGRLHWLNLGAAAGVRASAGDGLARFKMGWTPLTRRAYLGRHVFQPGRYAELCQGLPGTDFFPAYRRIESCATGTAA
jgi:GNAT acetyltransferase-like protein